MPPSHECANAGWQTRTYRQEFCKDTGCSPEDLPKVIDNRDEWGEWNKEICASSTTSW